MFPYRHSTIWMLLIHAASFIYITPTQQYKGGRKSYRKVSNGTLWSFKCRVYVSHRIEKHGLTRTRRETFKTAFLTNGISREAGSILKAISKGGILEREGFYSDGTYGLGTSARFYRCFKSFRQVLDQLKRAYKSRVVVSQVTSNNTEEKHIQLYDQEVGDESRSIINTTSQKGVQTELDLLNAGGKTNSMVTVSTLFLDDAGNEQLIDWLTKQVSRDVDSDDALSDCKARVIVQYRCCWESKIYNTITHWGEVYVLVG